MFFPGCKYARGNLKAYLDSELGPVGAWLVRRHLRRCRRCAWRLEGLRRLEAALRAGDPVGTEHGGLARH